MCHKKTTVPPSPDLAHSLAVQILPWASWAQACPLAGQHKVQDTPDPAVNDVRKWPHPPVIRHLLWDPSPRKPDSRAQLCSLVDEQWPVRSLGSYLHPSGPQHKYRSLGVLQPAASCTSPTNEWLAASAQGTNWQPKKPGVNQAH